ncbi:MAG: response regulator [Endomicrobiales bacterium]|jgi:DNA-binding response OmpR family regulator
MIKIMLVTSETALLTLWHNTPLPQGYMIDSAVSGAAALTRACADQPSIILLGPLETAPDVFTAQLERNSNTRHIPFLILDHDTLSDTTAVINLVTQALEQKRILIAEDDRQMSSILKTMLAKSGYAVTVAFDGAETLQQIKTLYPHLVILDIGLPIIDGFHICQVVNEDHTLPIRPKIIIISGRSSAWDKKLGDACGADRYMVKPFSFLELLENVRTILSGDS